MESSTFGWCSHSDMAEISCRPLTQPQRPKKPKLYGAILGLGNHPADDEDEDEFESECSLEVGGVLCRAKEQGLEVCPDIEYRVKCDCKYQSCQNFGNCWF